MEMVCLHNRMFRGYTGMTWNIDHRMEQHQSGKGSKFTSKHGFGKLVHTEEFDNIFAARDREYQIKDYSRKKKELLFKNKME